jgi:hypothetical protein
MLNLYIDFEIFVDFINKEPIGGVLNSANNEIENWNELWRFIKNGCNLTILNIPEIDEENINNLEFQYLRELSIGRNKSEIRLTKNFKKPFKNTFDLKKEFQSIFFLKENNLVERSKYLNKNPIPIGFEDNYLELFHKISLQKNEGVVKPVGKTDVENFSWNIIKEYFHFVTDIVIVDNYILKNKLLAESNFFEIVKQFHSINRVLNLTIVTYEQFKEPKLDFDDESNFIRYKLNEMGIQCKLNLILLTAMSKEHDRGIFTNFLRLKSGDSLNFINSSGEIVTSGTELDFHPLTNQNLFEVNDIALKSIMKKINKTPKKNKHLIIENRLLNI